MMCRQEWHDSVYAQISTTLIDHDQRAQPDGRSRRAAAEGADRVVGVDQRDQQREVEEVAVQVLQDQREAGLAGVLARAARRPRRPAATARTRGSRPCGSSSRSAGSRAGTAAPMIASGMNGGKWPNQVPKSRAPRGQRRGDARRGERRQVVVLRRRSRPAGWRCAASRRCTQVLSSTKVMSGACHQRSVRSVRAEICARPGAAVPVIGLLLTAVIGSPPLRCSHDCMRRHGTFQPLASRHVA